MGSLDRPPHAAWFTRTHQLYDAWSDLTDLLLKCNQSRTFSLSQQSATLMTRFFAKSKDISQGDVVAYRTQRLQEAVAT